MGVQEEDMGVEEEFVWIMITTNIKDAH